MIKVKAAPLNGAAFIYVLVPIDSTSRSFKPTRRGDRRRIRCAWWRRIESLLIPAISAASLSVMILSNVTEPVAETGCLRVVGVGIDDYLARLRAR
jgi:hypothetical protein